MTSRTPSVAERVRQSLREGRSEAELIEELIARGLSRPGAERVVTSATQSIRSAPVTSSSPPASVSPRAVARNDGGAKDALISGAFWLSVGVTVTLATYLAAPAGGRFVLAWGAIAAGLAAFARGLRRFLSTGQAFPWKGVLLAGGAPVGILVFIVAVVGFQIEKRRSQRRKVEEDRLEAVYAVRDRQEAERRREAARADQEARAASREKERTDRIERARLSLSSSQPLTACDAAGVLEKEGAVEAIPDLVGTVDRVTNALSARNCAAHALVGLGAPDRALDFFKECARLGTPDARTHAAAGFAAIGPRAAEFALPLLREELRSPYQDRRFWAVESLQQLGEAGRELLDTAAADSDATVRDRARQALAAMKPAG